MFMYRFIDNVANGLIVQAVDIFGYDILPSDKEVWDIVRNLSNPPSDNEMTSIFVVMFFQNLAGKLWEIDSSLQFDWCSNSQDSYFDYRFNFFEDFKPIGNLYEFVEKIKMRAKGE